VRARLALTLTAIAWLWSAPCLADQKADIDYLSGCLSGLSAREKPGLENLKPRCPELEHTLQQAGLTDQLPAGWEQRLRRSGLREITETLQRYQGEPQSMVPDVSAVGAIVQGLRTEHKQPPKTWWQRLGEWLRELLTRRSNSGAGLLTRALDRLADAMTDRVRAVLFYSCVALVVLFVGFIVWREVKAAGIGRRAAPRKARGAGALPPAATADQPGLVALDGIPLSERPALLLRLLVQALERSGRLTGDRTLTHRELIARAGFDGADQRRRFASISLRAEQQVYGYFAAVAHEDPELQRALHEGRELYLQLLAAPSAS
jgi:hypothetical protein